MGATLEYHGQTVSLLWQSKQARLANSRVRGCPIAARPYRRVGMVTSERQELYGEKQANHCQGAGQKIHKQVRKGAFFIVDLTKDDVRSKCILAQKALLVA